MKLEELKSAYERIKNQQQMYFSPLVALISSGSIPITMEDLYSHVH